MSNGRSILMPLERDYKEDVTQDRMSAYGKIRSLNS